MSDEENEPDNLSDGDEIEDEEEDEEESEEQEESEKGRTKKDKRKKKVSSSKRKRLRNLFFDEADVADEDEDEEDDYEDAYAGERKEMVEPEEFRRAQQRVEERQRKAQEYWSRPDAEIAEEYEQRHRDREAFRQTTGGIMEDFISGSGGTGVRGVNAVLQQSLLPGVGDPSIFFVKCKTGKEEQLVRSIMMKVVDYASKGQPLHIMSAFSTGSKGYLYIEAVAEPFAKEAIMNLRGINQASFGRVPIGQMTQVLGVSMAKKPLKEGQWVRMKRGVLKGDLVRVVSVLNGGEAVIVQAIPRPEYSATTAPSAAVSNKNRPVQRLFNAEEARKHGGEVYRRKHPSYHASSDMYDVWDNEYYRGGYLFKEVKVATYINANNIKPTLEELRQFAEAKPLEEENDSGSEDSDGGESGEKRGRKGPKPMDDTVSVVSSAQSYMRQLADQMHGSFAATSGGKGTTSAVPFVVGDIVQVTSGDLKSLVGKVLVVDEVAKLVKIRTIHEAFNRDINVEANLVVKYVRPGQHVKVIQGIHTGQTGRVVGVNASSDSGDYVAAILVDTINTEIMCNVAHLQVSSDVTTGLDSLGGYEMHDLVGISFSEAGVVVAIGTEYLTILNQMGVLKQVKPVETQGKRNMQSQRAHSFDSAHNSIGVNDVVNVVEGPFVKKTGTIKHIFKNHLWLHSTTHLKDSGIFVVRSRQVVLAGNKQQNNPLSDAYMGLLSPHHTPGGASPSQGAGSRLPMSRRGKETEIGTTVRIKKGAYKGHLAQVVDATETHYSVELLTQLRKITIEKDKTVPAGDKSGAAGTAQHAPVIRDSVEFGNVDLQNSTPFLTGRTPQHTFSGSETPGQLGNETPMRLDDAGMNLWSVNYVPPSNGWGNSFSAPGSGGGVGVAPPSTDPYDSSTPGSTWGGSTPGWGDMSGNATPGGGWRWSNTDVALDTPRIHGTGGSSTAGSQNYRNWVPNIIVAIKNNGWGGSAERLAVIVEVCTPVEDGYFKVQSLEGDALVPNSTQTLRYTDLTLAEVMRKHQVMIISGTRKGVVGRVQGINGDNVLVKVLSSGSMVQAKMSQLARMHTTEP